MRDLAGKTVFVTGGASGTGLAMSQAFGKAGMKVMLAEIDANALAGAVERLHDLGPGVRGVTCDAADPVSVEHAAAAVFEALAEKILLGCCCIKESIPERPGF